jgi:hypothetical protein
METAPRPPYPSTGPSAAISMRQMPQRVKSSPAFQMEHRTKKPRPRIGVLNVLVFQMERRSTWPLWPIWTRAERIAVSETLVCETNSNVVRVNGCMRCFVSPKSSLNLCLD